MGFYAPSAEDSYRYALRLGERERNLTDRFGWTILMVGDYSPVCQEFLADNCLDLCARTADRIRFVFFSDIPEAQFAGIARLANSGYGPRRGTLRAVLSRLRRPRVNFEDEGWRDLRPRAFVPLREAREITSMSHDRTAIPGAEEALRFAQRLGIGRHTPCLLVFTDIGDLRMHVLPFTGRSPDQVYARVRHWIDSYYEINRGVLDYWDSVESQIRSLAWNASNSLQMVRHWDWQRRRDHQALADLAELIHASEEGRSDACERLRALASHRDLPDELDSALQEIRPRIFALDRQIATRENLMRLADELAAQHAPEDISMCLTKLATESVDHRPLVRDARRTLAQADRTVQPRDALLDWWRRGTVAMFSKKKFSAWRRSWQPLADGRQRDYEVFSATVGGQRLTTQPERIADLVLAALELSPDEKFRAHLVTSLRRLQATAPGWLLESTLLIRDCVPPRGANDHESLHRFLDSAQELNALLQRTAPSAQARTEVYRRHRDLLCADLRSSAREFSTAGNDRRSALAALATFLESARPALERHIRERRAPSAPQLDLTELARLGNALDDYRETVTKIVYPHLTDPWVTEVRVATDLPHATGPGEINKPDALHWLRKSVSEAADVHREAVESWPAVQRRTVEFTATLTANATEHEIVAARELSGKIQRNEFDVFIAHQTADKPAVLQICHHLRQQGIYPWLDVEQIPPGTWFQDAIQSAVRTVRTAAILLGEGGVGRWQLLEIRSFLERCVGNGVPVIPVLLPGVSRVPDELPFLHQLQHVRFEQTVSEEDALRQLVWGITHPSPAQHES